MNAYPLVWNNPEKYKNNIIMIGTFHLIMSYFKIIGKKMAGSEFSDIVPETGAITTGLINGVINGKNYARALNCHKIISETIYRLLVYKYMEKYNVPNDLKTLIEEFLANANA